MLTISACSDSEGSDDSKKAKTSTAPTSSAQAKANAEAEKAGAITPQALEDAALSGKREGFDFKTVAKAEVEAGKDMKANKSECQPLASLAGGYTHIEAFSTVHRSLDPTDVKNATVGSMWLSTLSKKNAEQVMSDLRTSLKKCGDGFKTLGLSYKNVKTIRSPKLGDEALSYRITSVVAKQSVPMTYTVVRKDGVVLTFYGVNMLKAENGAIPKSVIEEQLKQLG
ncbi:hypothetical protein [Streptomyces sp. AC512_CC834]|uniref:hypothetical protein n=1 Tax=Streptomyces sp. AC512_CC834 TaxID=2823691 RepID=UPI0020B8B3B3|nr:hypothetical protein [Streptomyces sp. AC512_CC834]